MCFSSLKVHKLRLQLCSLVVVFIAIAVALDNLTYISTLIVFYKIVVISVWANYRKSSVSMTDLTTLKCHKQAMDIAE